MTYPVDRPDDIPPAIWEHAMTLWQDDERDDGVTLIARGVMAERARCATLARLEGKRWNGAGAVASQQIATAIEEGRRQL